MIDWLLYVLLWVYFIFFHDKQTPWKIQFLEEIEHLVGMAILLVMYFRLFSFSRFLGAFAVLVGVINAIIWKTWQFLFILGFFYLVSVLLLIKLRFQSKLESSQISLAQEFEDMLNWGVFSGFDEAAFDSHPLAFVPILLGALFLNILLLNILIAYFTKIFEELQNKQKIIVAKEIASIILQWEVLLYFLRFAWYRKSEGYSSSKEFFELSGKAWEQITSEKQNASKSSASILRRSRLLIIKKKDQIRKSENQEQSDFLDDELNEKLMKMVLIYSN